MKRTKNIIVYLPGFAGHLLQYLLGLDLSVVPVINQLMDNDSMNSRLEEYSFSNLVSRLDWQNFHTRHDSDRVSIDTWLATCYQTAVEAWHPSHIDKLITHPDVEYKIFVVELAMSEFACFWIGNAREQWDNFPVIHPKHTVALEDIKSQYKYDVINIDCFFEQSTWLDEYVRVCNLMNISPCITEATVLFNTWYDLRVSSQKEQFAKLTAEQRQTYVNNRINNYQINHLKLPSNVAHWQHAYNAVKDPSWPDCLTPEDYYRLPLQIQRELTDVFNIHPDMFNI